MLPEKTPDPVLYTVSLLLDAPPAEVEKAVSRALLLGDPGPWDGQSESMLFEPAQQCAERWMNEMSGSAPMPQLAATLHSFQRGAVSLGLRPLRPGEAVVETHTPRGRKWRVQLESAERDCESHLYVEEERSFARASTGGGVSLERSFKVQVYSSRILEAVKEAKLTGQLDDLPPNCPTGGVTFRCLVRPSGVCCEGRQQAELVRELLDERALCRAAPREVGHNGAKESRGAADFCLKELLFVLEEEARAWACAHGFRPVRTWRHVDCRINAVIWSSWFLSTMHCITAGPPAPHAADDEWLGHELAELLGRSRCGAEEPGTIHTQQRHLTEGSVGLASFGAMLQRLCRCAAPEDDIFRHFVDLGSGRGNAVLAAHAMLPFRACTGVELQEGSVELSRERAECYIHSGLAKFAASAADPKRLFVQGDFFKDIDWSGASVVFCAALCLSAEMIKDIAVAAQRLRQGALLLIMGGWHLSMNKKVSRELDLLQRFDFSSDACLVSWQAQRQSCNVYRRV